MIDCSLDRRRIEGMFFAEPYTFVINRDKFRTAYKLLRIEKVYFFFIFTRMLLKHHSNRSEYSGNLTLNLRTWSLEYAMNHHDSVFSLVFHQSRRIDLNKNLGNSGREEKFKLSPDCEQLM